MRRVVGAVVFGLVAAGCFVDQGSEATADGPGDASTGLEPTTAAGDATAEPLTTTDAPARCGDGVVDPGEMCDDGNAVNTDMCTSVCQPPICGDGFVQPGESCDQGPGNADNGGCTLACVPAACGDGKVQAGIEGCDDGNLVDDDGCTNACVPVSCGDGVVGADEECDDGNLVETDDCKANCAAAVCGDGVVASEATTPEVCDDGNLVEDDGCTTQCTPSLDKCGDGVLDVGEACDDGDLQDGDACSSACERTAYRVFVTSQKFDGKFDGLAGADATCAAAAQGAGLAGSFMAWISDDRVDAENRLYNSELPYVRLDGEVIAVSWDELTSGALLVPINRDEDGQQIAGSFTDNNCDETKAGVWTGTQPSGDAAGQHCNGWQDQNLLTTGIFGIHSATGPGWSAGCTGVCGMQARLYCFEQP